MLRTLHLLILIAASLLLASPGRAHEERMHTPTVAGQTGAGPARWLAGDHHVHSRFSTGYDNRTTPPTPIIGGDAIYPIPMNAIMARRFGLSWIVATDHGGANHSKVNHDHAYPELLESRSAVPEVVQFFGLELNSPGADHSSIIMPVAAGEAERLREVEAHFDANEVHPRDPARNEPARMLDALKALDAQFPKPVLIAHHPSRSATALGTYGLTTPSELRDWNDVAPEVAIGMEGAPGHQAFVQLRQSFAPSVYAQLGNARPRGIYGRYPTMGGFDQMTARLGGFWDSMLGEGRRWWITATSDSHVHWTDGGADFWPGEYSKTYVHATKDPAAILASLRAGRVFVSTGDLVSELDVTVTAAGSRVRATTGQTLMVRKGRDVTVTIRFLDPVGRNANGDDPTVKRVDLIRGTIGGRNADRASDTHPTHVEARFGSDQWRREGNHRVITHVIKAVDASTYVRIRGTSTDQLEPEPDIEGEPPWQDLWFYSNPVFIQVG